MMEARHLRGKVEVAILAVGIGLKNCFVDIQAGEERA